MCSFSYKCCLFFPEHLMVSTAPLRDTSRSVPQWPSAPFALASPDPLQSCGPHSHGAGMKKRAKSTNHLVILKCWASPGRKKWERIQNSSMTPQPTVCAQPHSTCPQPQALSSTGPPPSTPCSPCWLPWGSACLLWFKFYGFWGLLFPSLYFSQLRPLK